MIGNASTFGLDLAENFCFNFCILRLSTPEAYTKKFELCSLDKREYFGRKIGNKTKVKF